VVVAHDDLEAAVACAPDCLDGGDATVDREQQGDAGVGQRVDGLDRHAVALDEAARQVPGHVGAELAERLDGHGRGAEAVDVVVTVHDDAAARGDDGLDAVARLTHRPERERVVLRPLGLEEGPHDGRVLEPPADKGLGGHAVQPQLGGEPLGDVRGTRVDRVRGHGSRVGSASDAATGPPLDARRGAA
jgi:hypothetical protein